MEFSYLFVGMAYQLGYSYEKNASITDSNKFIDAESKIPLAMLGYGIGKYASIFIFIKKITHMSHHHKVYILGGVSILTLCIYILISSLSYRTYNPAWFLPALLLGISISAMGGQVEQNCLNKITEVSEEKIDGCMMAKILGSFIICLLGIPFRKSLPIDLLCFILITFVFAFVCTMMMLKGSSKSSSGCSYVWSRKQHLPTNGIDYAYRIACQDSHPAHRVCF